MSSKRVKSHHPDMDRALNPEEKTLTVPREIQFFTDYEGPPSQHPSTRQFSKPRYLPRQFKNLPSYFQLGPDVAPKSSMDEGCSKSCFGIEHHSFLNSMTPEELLRNYYGEEELSLGEYDDPPLQAYEKPWELSDENDKNSGGTMINLQTDEPAPPEYQVNNADRPKPKKANRSGSGKKKSAKAKKKAAKAKKLAKATKSSASATFNKNNDIPTTAGESPTATSAVEGQELVPLPPPPPYEELQPLTDIFIKIRIYKPFNVEENENATNTLYQNVVTENHDVPDIRNSINCSEEKKSMNIVNKGLLVMNNEISGDKTSADDDADSFNKWYTARRLADSAKNNTYSWWPDHLESPEHFKLFPDAALNTCYPAHLRFSYEYIQLDPKPIGASCGHVPGNMSSYCQLCFKGILCDDEGDKTCQYNRRQYKGGEGEASFTETRDVRCHDKCRGLRRAKTLHFKKTRIQPLLFKQRHMFEFSAGRAAQRYQRRSPSP